MIKVKARYEHNVLRPLEKLELGEGEEVKIELKRASVEDFHGGLEIANEIADEIIELDLWD